LKGDNRKAFESVLRRNIKTMLEGFKIRLEMRNGRFYLHGAEEDREAVERALSRLIGIAGWAQTRTLPKTMEDILAACVEEGKQIAAQGIASFKIEARRTDKSFPHDSFALRCKGGEAVLEAIPGLRVDVHEPGAIIYIEIREKAYIYCDAH
jgi:thiamine biosynthesis protein ThiI